MLMETRVRSREPVRAICISNEIKCTAAFYRTALTKSHNELLFIGIVQEHQRQKQHT